MSRSLGLLSFPWQKGKPFRGIFQMALMAAD